MREEQARAHQAHQDGIAFAMGMLTGAQEKIERIAIDDARLFGTAIIKVDLLSEGDGTFRVEVIDPTSVTIISPDPAKEPPSERSTADRA